jgi:hypothetical protein
LFPRKRPDDEAGGEEKIDDVAEPERKGDEAMRRRIEECMLSGTLDELRNGRLKPQGDEGSVGESMTFSSLHQQKPRDVGDPRYQAGDEEEDDDETGGGFFE